MRSPLISWRRGARATASSGSRRGIGPARLARSSGSIGVTCRMVAATAGPPAAGAAGAIALGAADAVWAELLAATPKRLCNDIFLLIGAGRMTSLGDAVVYAQYYPAAMRAIELLRSPAAAAPAREPPRRSGQFDSPVGRYVHLDLAGQEHRVYFEEAGSGIPVLLQHTAGCHGSQWRHLFERREITDHFRLIAYDLPYHGKSLPPVGPAWWAEEYLLTKEFLRAVPVSLAAALGLEPAGVHGLRLAQRGRTPRPAGARCGPRAAPPQRPSLRRADLAAAVALTSIARRPTLQFWKPPSPGIRPGSAQRLQGGSRQLMNGLMEPLYLAGAGSSTATSSRLCCPAGRPRRRSEADLGCATPRTAPGLRPTAG